MEKDKIRELIKKEIEKTKKQIEMCRENSQPVAPDDAIGRVSRMDAINNKCIIESALRQAEGKQKALEFFLSNVDKPEFGKCVRCGKEIPLGRILVRPESLLCINCVR